MSSVMEVGDIKAKIEQFGGVAVWVDAHKLDEIRDAVKTPHEGKPLIILAQFVTVSGHAITAAALPAAALRPVQIRGRARPR